ncbi:hypothetical protein AAX05_06530 [Moraxella bovoculi]|uniref:HTH lysR-type domain-containing protein n=1 Tax=Moraxella bovoculi TaxID=386891 RepID=A0AAC8PVL2_9GAMM|nr:LysR family transcriptional regulator [Moraxella bovoculi]AKG07531.1 hypothetical protein AAX06_04425 [Moraxella bovoculi]AKG09864.1 hypothetical protein AAX05_06530 [Moraxella bovoculi]AKG11785.1 hypothetical protein AAX07_07085 [Moraxella bovoculi]AKG13751.1 hypothetical protein AAX11_06615 [Moraxella bovoculi]
MPLIDKRVEFFYQVVSHGGVRAAADVLDVTPSIISRQIASLEKSLGMVLLQRHTKGVSPTLAGETVLHHYQHIKREQEHLKETLNALQGLKTGRVHISTGVGYLNYISQAVNDFSAKYPNISIEIDVCGSTEIIRKVIDSETDIGLLYNSINHPHLKSHFKAVHKLCAFMNPSHPLAIRYEITLNKLMSHKIALTDHNHGIRQAISQAESKLGIILPVTLLCNNMNLLKQYAQDDGITILPEFMLYPDDKNLTTRHLYLPNMPNTNTQIITRYGRHMSNAAMIMLRHMIEALKGTR